MSSSQFRPAVRVCEALPTSRQDSEQVEFARSAWRKYGKGRHPAALNFGDCFAYALAKSSAEALLAKATDFALTDIEMCPAT